MPTLRALMAVAALLALSLGAVPGCGEKEEGEEQAVGAPTTSGIAQAVETTWTPDGGLGEDQGAVTVELQHKGKAVEGETVVKLRGTGKRAGTVEKGKAGKRFVVEPGVYAADVEYAPGELARGKGKVLNLQVKPGQHLLARVAIDHPVGQLDLHFTNEGVDVDDRTRLSVYRAGDDPDVSVPIVARHPAGQPLILPKGSYDVHAEYSDGAAAKGDLWLKGIEVPGDMQKVSDTRDFGIPINGLTVQATNFGQDVNDRTTVYLYRPGADMSYAVAVASGKAGQVIPVEPGTYDLRVVYQPSDNPDTWADKRMHNVAIATTPENSKLSLTFEMEKPIGTLKVKVLHEGQDVTDKAQVRLINAGADRGAASDVVNVIGEPEIVVPAGKYEMVVSYKEGSKEAQGPWEAITVEQGAVVTREIRLGS